MLRFNDTDRRELRSDTSLLRGDRDKPRENSYLEQYQQARLPCTLSDCCSALETGILNISRAACYGHAVLVPLAFACRPASFRLTAG